MSDDLIARLRSSEKAFREHTVYDSEGDPLRLIVQADEFAEAASEIERLNADMGAARVATIEECAVAAEQQDRTGREWVRDSLWDALMLRAGENVRALKSKTQDQSK